METKQGFFDPKMPYPLDRRLYKATQAEILAIPQGARYLGMEIFAYSEGNWYQFKNGVTNGDLVLSDRGGSGGGKDYAIYEEILFVDQTNGSDTRDGLTIVDAVATMDHAQSISNPAKVLALFVLSPITTDFTVSRDNVYIISLNQDLNTPTNTFACNIALTGLTNLNFINCAFAQSFGTHVVSVTNCSNIQFTNCITTAAGGLDLQFVSGNPVPLVFYSSSGNIRLNGIGAYVYGNNGKTLTLNIYSTSSVTALILYSAIVQLSNITASTITIDTLVINDKSIVTGSVSVSLAGSSLDINKFSYFFLTGDLNYPTINSEYGCILEITGSYLGGQTYTVYPDNPATKEDIEGLGGGGGTGILEQIVLFNSDLDTVQEIPFSGLLEFETTSPFTSGLLSVTYQVRTEIATTWTDQSSLANVNTWISANISGDGLTGTKWRLRCIASYNTGEYDLEGITLNYTRA